MTGMQVNQPQSKSSVISQPMRRRVGGRDSLFHDVRRIVHRLRGRTTSHHHNVPVLPLLEPQPQLELSLVFRIVRLRVSPGHLELSVWTARNLELSVRTGRHRVLSVRTARGAVVAGRDVVTRRARIWASRLGPHQEPDRLGDRQVRRRVRRRHRVVVAEQPPLVFREDVLDAEGVDLLDHLLSLQAAEVLSDVRVDVADGVIIVDVDAGADAVAGAVVVCWGAGALAGPVHGVGDVEAHRPQQGEGLASHQISGLLPVVDVAKLAQGLVDGLAATQKGPH